MIRWAVCWLALIATSTAGVHWASDALVATRSAQTESAGDVLLRSEAPRELGVLGSPVCSQASHALVSVGNGAASDAPADQRLVWDRAAQRVLQACGAA
jgi:hypothetical protein